MKVSLVNASPKKGKNNSAYFLKELENTLQAQDIHNIMLNRSQISENDLETLLLSDVIVFSFPLYVDAIPSQLLTVLVNLEHQFKNTQRACRVYSIVNCGFYEGSQTHLALDILENWCIRANLNWSGGIGIGAGEMLGSQDTIPMGKGTKKNLGAAINALSDAIQRNAPLAHQYVTPNFPKFLFIQMANGTWKSKVRNNGLKAKQIYEISND
ncbi:MAG: NAD(P)H-dependent oxidoreductase [Oscillospiraceae bacterium]|nr:NAD(P)H-dependent oxidoreductase [Oscillospiraceae bacterium]